MSELAWFFQFRMFLAANLSQVGNLTQITQPFLWLGRLGMVGKLLTHKQVQIFWSPYQLDIDRFSNGGL